MEIMKIALVGRPNVGKSALFNAIAKKRIAIVDEAEGITRDRLYAETEVFGRKLEIIDTGGIHQKSKADFNEEVLRQAEIAIEEADSLILVVDGKLGLMDLDAKVAELLLKTHKPVTVAVNKIDNLEMESALHDFYGLGIHKLVAVSATQNYQIAELLESALKGLSEDEVEEKNSGPRIAIVGRANVGKSTLVNTLLDEKRCIVSPIPGTTRDSIDIPFNFKGSDYTLIDTAGFRRKRSEHEVVDKFAALRSKTAIDRAQVAVLVLDSVEGLNHHDKKILDFIQEKGCGCILAFNKWDLVQGFRMEHCLRDLAEEYPFLDFCPKVILSAKTGRNVEKIFRAIPDVLDAAAMRVGTGELNRFLAKIMLRQHPPVIGGRRLKVFYMAQVGIRPPNFVLFVNSAKLMPRSYLRYIYNNFRKAYQFTGIPLKFRLRSKGPKKNKAESAVY